MSDGATVDVVSDNGGKEQFGRFLTYRNGKPRKRSLVVGSIVAIVVVLVPALLLGPPSEEVVVTGADIFTIPQVGSELAKIEFPKYDRVDDLHRQDEAAKSGSQNKKAYGKPIKMSGPQLLARPRGVKIPPGAIVKAQLVSGASNGMIKAEIKEAVTIGGETVVEPGTIAIGQGTSSDSRLFIKISRFVYRDGGIDTVSAEGLDEKDKTPGLKGSKVGYQALRLAAGVGLNFAGGMAEGLQDTEGQQGVAVKKPSMRNALLNGAAQASLDQSKEMMTGLRDEAPVIEIPAGQMFYLIFTDQGG